MTFFSRRWKQLTTSLGTSQSFQEEKLHLFRGWKMTVLGSLQRITWSPGSNAAWRCWCHGLVTATWCHQAEGPASDEKPIRQLETPSFMSNGATGRRKLAGSSALESTPGSSSWKEMWRVLLTGWQMWLASLRCKRCDAVRDVMPKPS